MSKTKVSSRGQTVIPKDIRTRYGIKRGSEVEWQPVDAETVIMRRVQARQKISWSEWVKDWQRLPNDVWKGVDPVQYVREQRQRGHE